MTTYAPFTPLDALLNTSFEVSSQSMVHAPLREQNDEEEPQSSPCEKSDSHPWRSHTCGSLSLETVGKAVTLCGWVHRKRNHGGVLFLDLRDHYGITQCVFHHEDSVAFQNARDISLESVVQIFGQVRARTAETRNPNLKTGDIEVEAQEDGFCVVSAAQPLPISVNTEDPYPEDIRLTYRFLELRREGAHRTMVLRSEIIQFLRDFMTQRGFLDIQTPILSATSPEGARDYVVPSRLHPGQFYALPQAPQQFKQLLMTSGFDKYFQVAPCFRDEASRADRSPGEFYQLDMEMAFATQEDVWDVIEPLLYQTFSRFAPTGFSVDAPPFPRISYQEALDSYGTDKPDLRNPLKIQDYGAYLDLSCFQEALGKGWALRGIVAPGAASALSRKTLKELEDWAKSQGALGLAYITRDGTHENTSESPTQGSPEEKEILKGPLIKFCHEGHRAFLCQHLKPGDVLFLLCHPLKEALPILSQLRQNLGNMLNLVDEKRFAFCWVKDFPMYEWDEEAGAVVFSHNPFSMPQGGMQALQTQDPLTIKAFQYDIVCNGVELSSGAVRNHSPEIMYKAFDIAGYGPEHVKAQFGALLRAFHYGAPPHAGCAPGIDRMIMLLTQSPNLRHVIPFPLNQGARDLLMGAPCDLGPERLRELGLTFSSPKSSQKSASPSSTTFSQ